MENKDLKFLKKHYGENFAHLCRELFPTILEQEGVLSEIISNHFAQSRSIYDDIIEFKEEFQNYIYFFFKREKKEEVKVDKTPTELLDEAGYILFPECQTEKDIQSFKKYWAPGEELCTFRGGRLESCRVWFAVKKNVDKIRREDFKIPQRQDEYGTSAISIQFSKGKTSTLSIKNRYNHTVANPDSTFGNDLDSIISGLTQSFINTYKMNLINVGGNAFVETLLFYNYRMADDSKLYKVNIEADDINYCENNVILEHGHVVKLDKARYILAEKYIIDTQKNEVKLYKSDKKDSFIESLGEIDKISMKTDEKDNRVVVFTPKNGENVELTLNKSNRMLSYSNPNVRELGTNFLEDCKLLEELYLPKLEVVKDGFLCYNDNIQKINFPNLKKVGSFFIAFNVRLSSIIAPKLEEVGSNFLMNADIEVLNLPNLTSAKGDFLMNNNKMKELYLPKLQNVGDDFLYYNKQLSELNLPNLKNTGNSFLYSNTILRKLNLPNLIEAKEWFLFSNLGLTEVFLLRLEIVGEHFLDHNLQISKVNLPNLKVIGDYFLYSNTDLDKLELPNLTSVKDFFLFNNKKIEICLPKVNKLADISFISNYVFEKIQDQILKNKQKKINGDLAQKPTEKESES